MRRLVVLFFALAVCSSSAVAAPAYKPEDIEHCKATYTQGAVPKPLFTLAGRDFYWRNTDFNVSTCEIRVQLKDGTVATYTYSVETINECADWKLHYCGKDATWEVIPDADAPIL